MTPAVKSTPTRVTIIRISPGRKYQVLSWASLNQSRVSRSTAPTPRLAICRADHRAAAVST